MANPLKHSRSQPLPTGSVSVMRCCFFVIGIVFIIIVIVDIVDCWLLCNVHIKWIYGQQNFKLGWFIKKWNLLIRAELEHSCSYSSSNDSSYSSSEKSRAHIHHFKYHHIHHIHHFRYRHTHHYMKHHTRHIHYHTRHGNHHIHNNARRLRNYENNGCN